ncbi:uncharacterized protein EHS24_008337 [Apiotrichum porosum]|uniref:Uncharacterized protein n=1 Tax=Apiotrichum porosum TaxID=105984 RepID=A0A427XPZ0_9TREE|nr:uncharacterized protein EHS24_008337 [Apiotrichum porosum]RSH80909.1 hypothetical protein EHS24_008337 [Apiotrichum porosum]
MIIPPPSPHPRHTTSSLEMVQVRLLASTELPTSTTDEALARRADAWCESHGVEPHPVKTLVSSDETPTNRFYAGTERSAKAVEAVRRSAQTASRLEQKVEALEAEIKEMKTQRMLEQKVAKDRRSAIVLVAAVQDANTAFKCGGRVVPAQMDALFSASKDVNTKLGQALATLGPEVRSAFATNPSWTTQVDVHNDDAHPVWAKLLLELLELEDKAVPLTREAVTFVLLATRQRQIDGIEVVGVDEILEDVVILNKLFPTKRQMEWMKQLNLGV